MEQSATPERSVFLSTMAPQPQDRRLALAAVLVSVIVFIALVPFAQVPLAKVWAFIPIYESALILNDLITAVLLFGQFNILRSRALLILASGYLFSATIAAMHMLSFPGLFADTGLLGAGSQTTAYLFNLWHGGFAVFMIVYALRKNRSAPTDHLIGHTARATLASVTVAVSLALASVLLTTSGHDFLPAVIVNGRYTPFMIFIVASSWGLSLIALIALWRQRPHSILDLWLMVVMTAWVFDIALSAMLNHQRFDLGFYAGRIYGLLAASFVLWVLLLENGMLYARLVATHASEQRKTRQLTEAYEELESFSYSVSHDLRAPLRAVDGFARILEDGYSQRLDAEGQRLLGIVRTRTQLAGQLIDDLLAFSRSGRQALRKQQIEFTDFAQTLVTELRGDINGREIEFVIGELGRIDVDSALMRQALVNLLGNAIKFTRNKEHAVVEINCHEQKGERIFFIKDNGAGYDSQYAQKLFGVFQRLHNAKEFEGTGVGLAIVQRVIARHGGRIWSESALGQGATFYFTLPPARAGELTTPTDTTG